MTWSFYSFCRFSERTMCRKAKLPFKNVSRQKCSYILGFLILLSICVLYLNFNEDEFDIIHLKSSHALCILVPYRDAFEELQEFVPHMSRFLNRQRIRFYIDVFNQIDHHRFNKGALFDAGFQIITKTHPDCDYIGLHDVDYLPLNDEISYAYPGDGVFHVTSPHLLPFLRSMNPSYLGGIVLIPNDKFVQMNGASTKYWGWGGEDNELLLRVLDQSIEIKRPGKLSTSHTNSFRHTHRTSRKRDRQRCLNQTQNIPGIDRLTGLNTVDYKISTTRLLTIDGFPFSFYNLNVSCKYDLSPWCDC